VSRSLFSGIKFVTPTAFGVDDFESTDYASHLANLSFGHAMNLRQKHYFTLLQMLETMQAAITNMQEAIKDISETTEQTSEVAYIVNARLLLAGQALLGKTAPGFKTEYEEKFRYVVKLPE
jgi:hypothetical protein